MPEDYKPMLEALDQVLELKLVDGKIPESWRKVFAKAIYALTIVEPLIIAKKDKTSGTAAKWEACLAEITARIEALPKKADEEKEAKYQRYLKEAIEKFNELIKETRKQLRGEIEKALEDGEKSPQLS